MKKSFRNRLILGMISLVMFFLEGNAYAAIITERFGGSAPTLDVSGVMMHSCFYGDRYNSTGNQERAVLLHAYGQPFEPANGGSWRNAVYFDVSFLSPGTTILKAEYVMSYDTNIYPLSTKSIENGLSMYRILDPDRTGMWNPDNFGYLYKDGAQSIRWTNSGGTFADCVDPRPVATVYGLGNIRSKKMFYFFDITSLVQDWVNNPNSNIGVTFGNSILSDKVSEPDNRPYLEITYIDANPNPPPQPTNLNVFYRSGQTFLTWQEVFYSGEFYDMLYRIYRHTGPITASNLDQAQLVGEVNQLSSYNTSRSERLSVYLGRKVDYNYVINEGQPELSEDTGLFVYTAKQNGNFYYAVTCVEEGNENRTDFISQNSLQAPVSELVAFPEAVRQDVEYIAGRTVQQFVHWADERMSYKVGYGFNFMLNLSASYNPVTPNPMEVILTGRGASYYNTEAYTQVAIHPEDYMPSTRNVPFEGYATSDGMQTWWSGCRNNYKQQTKATDGVVVPWTENRILYYIEFAKRKYNIDDNRIYMRQFSMGGTGTISLGLKHPEIFASLGADHGCPNWRLNIQGIDANYNVTREGYRNDGNQLWGKQDEGVLHENGTPIWDWMDAGWYALNNIGQESPFLEVQNGKRDGAIAYFPMPKFYKEMKQAKRGFTAQFLNQSHSPTGAGPRYKTIVRNESFPALNNCSLDANPGGIHEPTGMALAVDFTNPLPTFDGDLQGEINGFNTIEWSRRLYQFDNSSAVDDMVDVPDRYELALRLQSKAPQDTATMDITPRRLQQFSRVSGADYLWQNKRLSDNSIIQSGQVTADSYGLITVLGFIVEKTTLGNKLIITPAGGATIIGDVNGDKLVNILDIQALVNHILGTQDWGSRADVNGDESVNVLDVQEVVNIILRG